MNQTSFDDVMLYTDGGSSGNPGPGGYGVVLQSGGHRKELSGGFRRTTNNRMELLAVITGLKSLRRPCRVTVVSDSQYVVDSVEKKWLDAWQKRNWKTAGKQPVKNIDLWKQLLELLETHEVRFQWIRGHNGHAENERCDRLAVEAYGKAVLPPDVVFESSEE